MLILFYLFYSLPGLAASAHETQMQKINFNYVSEVQSFYAEGSHIKMTYYGFSEDEALKVFKIMKQSMKLAPEFLREQGHKTKWTCEDYSIDLYDIPKSVLNDHTIMTFINSGQPYGRIRGFYDSEDSPPGKSSIFISASDRYVVNGETERARRKVISHEILHYWQERTCNNRSQEKMQSQAMLFENRFANSFEASLY